MGMTFKDNPFETLREERMVLTCHHKNTTFHQKSQKWTHITPNEKKGLLLMVQSINSGVHKFTIYCTL
jgi:hypothetical protein